MKKHIFKMLTLIIMHLSVYAMHVPSDDSKAFDFEVTEDELCKLENDPGALKHYLTENAISWNTCTNKTEKLSNNEAASALIVGRTKGDGDDLGRPVTYLVEVSYKPEKPARTPDATNNNNAPR